MDVRSLAGDVETVIETMERARLTDGLPIVVPTLERVSDFLQYADRDPDDPVAVAPTTNLMATAGLIAANAVMAGCRPEQFPVVLAAVAAIFDGAFNIRGVSSTTNPGGPLLIVNGPVRHAGEYNAGGNALGPGNRANATTGRAVRLVLLNIAGAEPQRGDMATLGWPGKYTFCFPENEERSPWSPLHVTRGFNAEANVVTVTSASGMVNIMGGDRIADELFEKIAGSMRLPGSNDHAFGRGNPVLILSPEHARVLASGGYTREILQERLVERSTLELSDLSSHNADLARKSRDASADRPLRVVEDARDLTIVVTGGPGVHSYFVMSFGESRAVSREIK
jgi:hypothetical protein